MKKFRILTLALSIVTSFHLMSCTESKRTFEKAGFIKHFAYKSDPSKTFEVYYPADFDPLKKYPFVVSFDSKADGLKAIEGFKKGADDFSFIIIGSNVIKSGIPDYEKQINQLFDEIIPNIPIEPSNMYFAGFSGGARMATNYGIQKYANGIISCGAAIKASELENISSTSIIYNIAGTRDFNYAESYYSPLGNEVNMVKYFSTSFTGTHEWPNQQLLYDALEFMYTRLIIVNDNREKPVSESFIISRNKTTIDSLKKKGEFIKAHKACERALKMFAGTDEEEDFRTELKVLESSSSFTDEIMDQKDMFQIEEVLTKSYIGSMLNEPKIWWERELSVLNDTISKCKRALKLDMLYRVKGVIGIVCYSQMQQNLASNNLPVASKILEIYEIAEPNNPDVYFFKALLIKQSGIKVGQKEMVTKAIQLGFTDTARISSEFPDFKQ